MSEMYDFDKEINRRNTGSLKWDVPEGELPMWVADMDFETAPAVKQALEKRAAHGVFGYSILPDAWYEAYRNWWSSRHGLQIEKEWLVFCTGVIPALSTAVRKLTTPGEKILIQTPVYNIFFNSIINNGRFVAESPLAYDGDRYTIDWEDLEQKLSDPQVSMMILCNPHNPVGRVWTREELERVAEICLKYNVTWMVDEMHCDFIFPGHTFTSCMNLDEKYRQIFALYSSPGKTFNVAGLQPANIIIPNEELRKKYQWANTQAAYSQGSLMGQLAVKVCYTKGAGWVDELVQYIYENVQYMSKFVKENFPKAKMVEPEGTYLVWVDFSGYGFSNEELEHLMLEEAKLWLDSGIIFGPETAQFERFNVACPRATVKQALTQLKDALDKHLAAK